MNENAYAVERVLRKELAEARKTIKEQKQTILAYEVNDIRCDGVYLAAALKFGTMVGPGVMEMTLPTDNIRCDGQYEVNVRELPDRNSLVVRVKHRKE